MARSCFAALAALCMSLMLPVSGTAALVTERWETFRVTQRSPCTGETFESEVEVHVVGTETLTASGSLLTGLYINSVSGIGTAESGQVYLLRDGSATNFFNAFLEPSGTAQVFTGAARLLILALGQTGQDFYQSYVVHATWTPDGTLVVDMQPTEGFCR
jgi:hypothetical protein